MCLFVNFKFTKLKTSQFTKLKILKLQVHFGIFTSLHMLDFHVFILACPTKLSNFQLQNIKLQIAKLQVYKLHLHICKFQTYTKKAFQFKIIIKTKIASTCLQICKITKITNCKCIFAYLQVCTY